MSVREARRNFSALLDQVKQGEEIVLTEHGRPVAKLVPPDQTRGAIVPDFAAFRRGMPVFDPSLSSTVTEDRDDRV